MVETMIVLLKGRNRELFPIRWHRQSTNIKNRCRNDNCSKSLFFGNDEITDLKGMERSTNSRHVSPNHNSFTEIDFSVNIFITIHLPV
jgi:hypothetical protein